MALGHIDQGDTATTSGISATSTVASASFTPALGALITVSVVSLLDDGGGGNDTHGLSNTGFTVDAWVQKGTTVQNSGDGFSLRTSEWYATVTSSAAGVITCTRTPSVSRNQWMVIQVDEWSGHTGVGQYAGQGDADAAGTTLTVTFASTPAVTSGVAGILLDNNGSTTGAVQPTGWTETADIGGAGVGDSVDAGFMVGSVPQANTWTSLQSGTFGKVASAIEILAAGGAGYTGPGVFRQENNSEIVKEDGTRLVLEAGSQGTWNGAGSFLSEDGFQVQQEDATSLLFEAIALTAVTDEQGRYVLTEAGDHLLLESAGGSGVSANPVAATVTVTATNPTVTRVSNAGSVSASVAVTASNPSTAIGALANAVAATVTATATNPVVHGAATANAVAATVTISATNPTTSTSTSNYWFDDEFPGSSIDTGKWTVYNRLGDQVNSEVNAVIPANVRVSSGTLKIDSKFEDVVAGDTTTGAPNPRTVHYTSGQVALAGEPFRYGTVDVRAKICGGTGTWPCIWMLGFEWQASQPYTANVAGANWPADGWWEIDIAEFLDGHRSLQNCALHFVTASRTGSGEKTLPFDATTRFMVYRLEWTATSLVWKVDAEDGVGFRTLLTMTGTAGTDIPNTPGYLIIHTAIGGRGGTPVSGTFPVSTEVDWARISLAAPSPNIVPVYATVTATAANPAVSGGTSASANAVAATVTVSAANPVAHGASTANPAAATVTVTATNPSTRLSSAASPVAATVAVTATDPATTVSSKASSVAALVTVTAANPVGSVAGDANALAVSALVTVTASNPTVHGTATAAAVSALVTVTAANPARTALSNASAVAALVAVTASNPTVAVSSAATAVAALIVVTATDPVAQSQGNGTASAVVALVAVTASNPAVSGSGVAVAVGAVVVVSASNPGVHGSAIAHPVYALVAATAWNPAPFMFTLSTVFFGARRSVRRDPFRQSVRRDPLRLSRKV